MAGLPVPGYGQPTYGPLPSPGAVGSQNGNVLQLLMQLIGQSQGAQNEAKQANESRYQDILKPFGDNRQRTMGALNDFGTSLVNDANKTYTDKRNNMLTDLADRGLSGSTKRIAVEDASQREKDAAVNRIKDMLIQNKTGADLGFTDRAAGVMERRSDPYPDTSNLNGLVAQLGGLLGGGGGGAFGGGQQSHLHSGVSQGGMTWDRTNGAPTVDAVTAQRAALQAQQNANANDVARQNGMAALTNAMRKGGVEGEDATRQALSYLQSNGWAQQNPAQGVPQVNFGRSIQPSQPPQMAGVYTRPQSGSNPYYQQRMAGSPNGYMPSQKFGIAGDASPTGDQSGGGLSPFGQLGAFANLAGYAGQAASPFLGQLRSYLGY